MSDMNIALLIVCGCIVLGAAWLLVRLAAIRDKAKSTTR